jgi:uncharacterized membrane protein
MSKQPTPNRLEAFSDGVIAVIVTIMVLDLKVPHADGLAGFLAVLPSIAVYLLSFLLTGLYWINHHALIDRLKHVDALILWANLFFLFTLSLIPFFTNYLVEKGIRPFPVGLYAASLRKGLICLGTYLIAIAVAFYHPLISLGLVAVINLVWVVPGFLVKPTSASRKASTPHPTP